MTIACAVLASLAFVGLLLLLKVVERAGQSVSATRRAVADLKAATSDDERERISQRAAVAGARLFLVIAVSVLVAAAAPLALVLLLDVVGWASFDAVVAVLASPAFIAASLAVGAAAWLAAHRYGRRL